MEDRFPACKIHVAKTVAQAVQLIKESRRTGTYDLAILDYRLPATEGASAIPETGLKSWIRSVNPSARIVRVTAYSNEPMLEALEEHRPECRYLEDSFITKRGDVCAQVADWVLRVFHTLRIQRDMHNLLTHGSTRPSLPQSFDSEVNDRQRNLDASMFFMDAGQHWDFLAPGLQTDLANAFGHARTEDGRHLLGVVTDTPSSTEA